MAARFRIKAHANLRHYLPGAREDAEVEMPAGATIDEVLGALGIPASEVMSVKVGPAIVKRDHVPRDGDLIEFLPILSGG